MTAIRNSFPTSSLAEWNDAMSDAAVTVPASENTHAHKSEQADWSNPVENDDFTYVPMSPWAPISLVTGILSVSAMSGLFGLGLAFFGILIGLAAFGRIRGAQGAVKGAGLALLGVLLSGSFLAAGSFKMKYAYDHEVPDGYERVTFTTEIADKKFQDYRGQRRLHKDVAPLIGKSIYIKGYMWQTQRPDGLTDFVFLKDNGDCCFGGKAKPHDMMVVRMNDGKTTRSYEGTMIAVAGVLNADVQAGEDDPVYTIDADIVKEAPTPF